MAQTIDSMVRWWSKERPEQTALSESGRSITFAELDKWVGQLAADYVETHGVTPGDRVCICAQNCIEWCVAALATLRVGGIVAGLSHRMVPDEIAYLLGDYAPALLVVDETGEECTNSIEALESRHGDPVALPSRLHTSTIRSLRARSDGNVHVEVDADAPAVIVTTSGSTARPKGVMYSNHSIIDAVSSFMFEDPVRSQPAKMYVVAPFNTSAGGVLFIHSLIQGGSCYFAAEFEPSEVLDVLERERVAIFCAAPIFLQRIADLDRFSDADVSSIEISYTGGAAVATALLAAWSAKGVTVRQMYGQTESGGWGINNPREFAFSDPDRCGRGSPTKDIMIIDEVGNELPAGEPGQIIMRGPGTMLGYWNDPETTARTIVGGWLHTGDIGVVDERGLLKFVDRAKDIIISGGLNISAAEVERVIMDLGGVDEVAVLAAPDDRFGETPLAVVYGEVTPSIDEIITHCNAHMSSHKVPRYIVVSAEPLPRLATGKISKPALRRAHLDTGVLPERVR